MLNNNRKQQDLELNVICLYNVIDTVNLFLRFLLCKKKKLHKQLFKKKIQPAKANKKLVYLQQQREIFILSNTSL